MSALANFWSWLTGGTGIPAKDLPEDTDLAMWVQTFSNIEDDQLRAALDMDDSLKTRHPGHRAQLHNKMIKWRRVNRTKHVQASLDNALADTGLVYFVKYFGGGDFRIHINGIDPKADDGRQED